MIWGNISRSVNGENVLGGVAYKNKYLYCAYMCMVRDNERGVNAHFLDVRAGGPSYEVKNPCFLVDWSCWLPF